MSSQASTSSGRKPKQEESGSTTGLSVESCRESFKSVIEAVRQERITQHDQWMSNCYPVSQLTESNRIDTTRQRAYNSTTSKPAKPPAAGTTGPSSTGSKPDRPDPSTYSILGYHYTKGSPPPTRSGYPPPGTEVLVVKFPDGSPDWYTWQDKESGKWQANPCESEGE
jgi:hypothetical protein